MNPRLLFNLGIGVAALVAIAVVAGPSIGLVGDDDEGQVADTPKPAREPGPARRPGRSERREAPRRTSEEKSSLPADPDDVKGDQEISLHRPANLRRALRVLEGERRRAEGVFDGLRVAPAGSTPRSTRRT